MTARVRCCKLLAQPVPHSDQPENSDTTQSRGQGTRQACSAGGCGVKYSHISLGTMVLLSFWRQWTLRRCSPCCAVTQALAPTSPPAEEMSPHLSHAETSHSNSSRCQSQILKHLLWLSGLSFWLQFAWYVVQPSTWVHQMARLRMPPEPQSPTHRPQ